MPVPVPPTDNLYKFAAIAGLLLVISSTYIFVLGVRDSYEALGSRC